MLPAELIATNLAALPHPDGTPRHMPGFQTQLLPEPLQEQVSQNARELGEAIVHLLESSGYRILTDAQIQAAGQPAPAADPQTLGSVHCNVCDTKLFQLNMVNPSKILTNPQLLIAGIGALNPECPHGAI